MMMIMMLMMGKSDFFFKTCLFSSSDFSCPSFQTAIHVTYYTTSVLEKTDVHLAAVSSANASARSHSHLAKARSTRQTRYRHSGGGACRNKVHCLPTLTRYTAMEHTVSSIICE